MIGVVGPMTSRCAVFEIPELNSARGGPVATVSGSATLLELTREGPGTAPGAPEAYYPTGTRNFARVVAADHIQGAADALIAKRLGVRRLFVLDDGLPYGAGIAESVRTSARRLGLAIAGSGRWDQRARSFRALAAKIEASGADGVFLGGFLTFPAVRLLRDLRAELGGRFQIVAPDGFSDDRALVREAGPAAEGMVYSVSTIPVGHLPGPGRRFAAAFSRAIGGAAPPLAVSAAQATDVLLTAIAASDGTRASVTRKLLKTRVENGLLGSFGFDANGDTTAAGVTIYRIEQGESRVHAVITPPASLTR